MKAPKTKTQAPLAAPEGFVLHLVPLATVDCAAELFEVTPRTIRNWISTGRDPAPVVRRDDEGLPPLISIAAMRLWVALQRMRDSGFGRHGGAR